MKNFLWFTAIFFFSLLTQRAFAIICYDCDSIHDPRCNEYFYPDGVKQTDCEYAEMPLFLQKYGRRLPATGCITRFQEGVDGRRFFVRRGCYYGDPKKTEEACTTDDPYLPFTDILSCEVCEEDLCVGNDARKISILSVLFSLLLGAFISII